MEKDPGSWFKHQHYDQQSLDLNSISGQFDLGRQHTVPNYMNPCCDTIPTNGTLPMFAFSDLQNTKGSQSNEPHNWFSNLPHFHEAFVPMLNSVSKEGFPSSLNENFEGLKPPYEGSNSTQRKFLVFDHSDDQTTLIFRSVVGTPVQCLTSWSPNLPGVFNLNRDGPVTKREIIYPSEPFLADYGESNRDDASEMREDTEELNALLYSDDEDDYSENDEEASTGHSPSIMPAYDKQEWSEESCEEVASSSGPTKRQKLSSGECFLPPLVDTTHFVKDNRCFDCKDEPESICSDGSNQVMRKKRSREEEIRNIINILGSIIPGGKGKDAIAVLDEAMHYLGSLKLEAKALGLAL